MEITKEVKKRFWSKVKKTSGCWTWTAGRHKQGYGEIQIGRKCELAHRVAWVIYTGLPIPEGLKVLHKCDNPPCVRWSHLFLGTQLMNMQDASAKGRCWTGGDIGSWVRAHPGYNAGEKHASAKLTWKDVTEIRQRKTKGETNRIIAGDFCVSETMIAKINRGEKWKELNR